MWSCVIVINDKSSQFLYLHRLTIKCVGENGGFATLGKNKRYYYGILELHVFDVSDVIFLFY